MIMNVKAHIATGEVTALKHKIRDHTMKLRSSIAKALLAGAESTEILGGPGYIILIKIEIDTTALI